MRAIRTDTTIPVVIHAALLCFEAGLVDTVRLSVFFSFVILLFGVSVGILSVVVTRFWCEVTFSKYFRTFAGVDCRIPCLKDFLVFTVGRLAVTV